MNLPPRMKIKDVRAAIKAGTPVAVATGWNEKGKLPMQAVKAEVIATNLPRRVHSSARWDTGGHSANDAIHVAWLGDGASGTTIVAPTAVLMSWDEYVVLRDQTAAALSHNKSKLDAEKAAIEHAASVLGGNVGRITDGRFDVVGYRLTLSSSDAIALAARVEGEDV